MRPLLLGALMTRRRKISHRVAGRGVAADCRTRRTALLLVEDYANESWRRSIPTTAMSATSTFISGAAHTASTISRS